MSDTSGGRDRPRAGFLREVRGQSETIGVVLILGMVILGMTAVIGFGSQALDATEQRSEIANAEQAMAQFDSKAAQVALGDSAVQSVPLGSGGRYEVRDKTGRIEVQHINYTRKGDNETIYNGSLGAVVYRSGDTEIAYQGGGVWRKDAKGNSTMVSPPEFHYRDETLTLPIINVTTDSGSDDASGAITGVVSAPESETSPVYPNASQNYTKGDISYANPVNNGTIAIEVHSRYYHGWAEYFRTRTEGNVTTVEPANPGGEGTAKVILEAPVQPKNPFKLSNEPFQLRGVNDSHPVEAFSVSLADPGNSNGFKHLYWSFHAQSGNKKFELLFYSADKQRCKNGRDTEPLYVGVYYQDASGATHEWENAVVDPDTGPIRIVCDDIDDDGKNEPRLNATIVPKGNPEGGTLMRYTEITTPADKWAHDPSGTAEPKITFDEHTVDNESKVYQKGQNTTSLGLLVTHYFSLLGPEVDLTVSETSPCGCRIDEDSSFGRLEYTPSGGRYITYLHITENEVEVRLE